MRKVMYCLGTAFNMLLTLGFVVSVDSFPIGFNERIYEFTRAQYWLTFLSQLIFGIVLIAFLWMLWVVLFNKEIQQSIIRLEYKKYESDDFEYTEVEFKEVPERRLSRQELDKENRDFHECYNLAVGARVDKIINEFS